MQYDYLRFFLGTRAGVKHVLDLNQMSTFLHFILMAAFPDLGLQASGKRFL
jgi:hypothetical protein